MPDRDVKGVEGLSGQRAAAAVGDGHRNHHRNTYAPFFEHLLDRGDCRLGVERVEDRFHEQQIDAAVDAGREPDLRRPRAPRRRSFARNAGLFTSGEIDSVRFIGPIDPGDETRAVGVFAVHSSAASRATRAPARFSS